MEQGPNCARHLLLSVHSVYRTVVTTRTFASRVASRVVSRPVCMGPQERNQATTHIKNAKSFDRAPNVKNTGIIAFLCNLNTTVVTKCGFPKMTRAWKTRSVWTGIQFCWHISSPHRPRQNFLPTPIYLSTDGHAAPTLISAPVCVCRWSELTTWQHGVLVKHVKGLFKADGINNAAEPGNSMHSRFYVSSIPGSMWGAAFQVLCE